MEITVEIGDNCRNVLGNVSRFVRIDMKWLNTYTWNNRCSLHSFRWRLTIIIIGKNIRWFAKYNFSPIIAFYNTVSCPFMHGQSWRLSIVSRTYAAEIGFLVGVDHMMFIQGRVFCKTFATALKQKKTRCCSLICNETIKKKRSLRFGITMGISFHVCL